MSFKFRCNICKILAEGRLLLKRNHSGSAATSLPRDIHAAPPDTFVVRLSEIIGRFMTLRKMALFWWRVVEEVSIIPQLIT